MKKIKNILFISSSQHFVEMFLKDFFLFLSNDYKINLITNISSYSSIPKKVDTYHVNISRKISILTDILSTIKIIFHTFKIKASYVITTTPKCVIFGSIIKLLLPNIFRVHIYTGITWTNMTGTKKNLFILIDKLNIFFSNRVLFDSKEQIQFFKENGLSSSKFFLINNGSIKGVNANIFFKYNSNLKNLLKEKYNIPSAQKVILYMGRMDAEKGILDLIESFMTIIKKNRNVILLLVGKDEININRYLKLYQYDTKKIIYLSHNNSPQDIYNLADIFCLPSKREGFGNVLIESSAVELPIIASDIFGLKSSLINGFNGLTFKVGKINELTDKLIYLIENENTGFKFGKNGRNYVIKNFNPYDINVSLEKLIFN